MKQVEQNLRTGRLRVATVPAPRVNDGCLLIQTQCSLVSAGTERQISALAKSSIAGKALARPDLVRRVFRNAKKEGLRPTFSKVMAKLDTPIPLGYSAAGTVLEVGRGVHGFSVGDQVACAGAGFANHAEVNAIPKNLCVRVPDCVSLEEASFANLGAVALQGIRQTQPTLGERVVVMGLGLVGLLTVQLLKANGCKVLGFDPNKDRCQHAKDLGADDVAAEDIETATRHFTQSYGADAVIVTASTRSNEPVNTAARISRRKGRVVVVGLVGMDLARDLFYERELDLRLSMSSGPGRYDPTYELLGHDYPFSHVRWTENRNMQAFLEFVAEKQVKPSALISHRYSIENAEHAYSLLEGGEDHLGILLEYPPAAGRRQNLYELKSRRNIHRAAIGASQVGFIGAGSYAQSVLIPAVRNVPHASLTAVATARGLSAEHTAARFGFDRSTTNTESLISDDTIDTVVIATRHDTHAELAIAALEAGKNVFCEKPIALNDFDLRSVIVAARLASGIFSAGFNRRFSPAIQKAKTALSAARGPLMMHYRVNAGAVPPESWVQRAEGGGRIIGEVCHFVDTLTYLCGALPTEVSAIAAGRERDAVSALISFADGSTGTILFCPHGDRSIPKEQIEVLADGVVIQIEDFKEIKIAKSGSIKKTRARQDKGQKALISAFFDAVRTGGSAPIAYEDLSTVTETTFAIEDALRLGSVIVIGDKSEGELQARAS